MKLLGSTQSNNGENLSHLKINQKVLVDCSTVIKNYQQDSRVLYTFIPNKSFGPLLDILPKNYTF